MQKFFVGGLQTIKNLLTQNFNMLDQADKLKFFMKSGSSLKIYRRGAEARERSYELEMSM